MSKMFTLLVLLVICPPAIEGAVISPRACPVGYRRRNNLCILADDDDFDVVDWRNEVKPACVLPQYPRQGTYKVANKKDAEPGQSLASVELIVSCRRGFGVMTADGNLTSPNRHKVQCVSGKWKQKMPKCVRFCKLADDMSIQYTCHVEGEGFKNCNGYVPPGTTVKPMCRSPLYYATEEISYINCIDGVWDKEPQCKADCGRITPEGEELVIGGRSAKHGELPWYAGVYRKTDKIFEQICGGSLISNNAIISAAHCFWDDTKKQMPAKRFAVAVGKLFRDWITDKDLFSQKSNVKTIHIPEKFGGSITNFQEDIAVVIVVSPFTYQSYIRPVCLNYDEKFENWQLSPGNLGQMAGWGWTDASSMKYSSILRVVDMMFFDAKTCSKTLPRTFSAFLTTDKFCAGKFNGTAGACRGDSGSGLTFADAEYGLYRHYLRGVVSTAPPTSTDKSCNDESLVAFTAVSKHESFIKRSLAASMKKKCPQHLFQCADDNCLSFGVDCNGVKDCADGSDEDEYLCNPVPEDEPTKPMCVLPPYPSHGGYKVLEDPYAQPNQAFNSTTLIVFCFRVLGTQTDTFTDYDTVNCTDGRWSGHLPDCLSEIFCDKSDGTKGLCVPFDMCYLHNTYDEYGNDTMPCRRDNEVCCSNTEKTMDIKPLLMSKLD